MNIQSISLEKLKQVISIKEQITSLESKLAKLLDAEVAAAPAPVAKLKKGRRKMSAAAKAKIAAAAKARWAKVKAVKAVKVKPVAAAKPARKKPSLSPEGRARIVAALKARWAKQKKGK